MKEKQNINKELDFPYNISEWKRIGIERGYYKYFEEEIKNKILKIYMENSNPEKFLEEVNKIE